MTAQPAENEEPVRYYGAIVIEWPSPCNPGPNGYMLAHEVTITNAETGKFILGCTAADLVIHGEIGQLVIADLSLFADENGEPIFEDKPVEPGKITRAVFPFLVAEMRVRSV